MGLEFLLCMKMDRSNGRIAENEAIFHCHLEANLQKLMWYVYTVACCIAQHFKHLELGLWFIVSVHNSCKRIIIKSCSRKPYSVHMCSNNHCCKAVKVWNIHRSLWDVTVSGPPKAFQFHLVYRQQWTLTTIYICIRILLCNWFMYEGCNLCCIYHWLFLHRRGPYLYTYSILNGCLIFKYQELSANLKLGHSKNCDGQARDKEVHCVHFGPKLAWSWE